jgi:hypothetical protein
MSIVLSRRPRTASRAPPTTTMTCWRPFGASSVATSCRYDRIWSAVMRSCTSGVHWFQVPPQAVGSHCDPSPCQLWRRQPVSSLPHPGCSGAGPAMCERWDVTRPGRPSDPCVIARLLGDSGQQIVHEVRSRVFRHLGSAGANSIRMHSQIVEESTNVCPLRAVLTTGIGCPRLGQVAKLRAWQ